MHVYMYLCIYVHLSNVITMLESIVLKGFVGKLLGHVDMDVKFL